jgi:hypothetical protein
MLRKTFASLLLLGLASPLAALADNVAKFDGGIGVIPMSSISAAGVVTRNVVRGVQPPGQPWRIADLAAAVDNTGQIVVDGRGLLLAGGNGLGTNGNASVFATLICEATAPFVERSTNVAGVKLEANGDFRIQDVLIPAPVDCASPVLLIRNSANLGWFAAGIVKQ